VGAESRITDARAKQLVGELLEGDADAVRARKARFDVAATLPLVP
jgi:hypothetical protein